MERELPRIESKRSLSDLGEPTWMEVIPSLFPAPSPDQDADLRLPIGKKVLTWSPYGKWIAHWEGVEMIHMSHFTGIVNPMRDQQISETFSVWVVSSDGRQRRKVDAAMIQLGRPMGLLHAHFQIPKGGPKIIIETESGEKELPLVPHKDLGRVHMEPQKRKRLK